MRTGWLLGLACLVFALGLGAAEERRAPAAFSMDQAKAKDWLARWEKNIVGDSRNRYCDKEMGEELGWLVAQFLNGYYYGYMATGDVKWVDRLVDWSDSCIKRGIKEPDGYLGWPKGGATGTERTKELYTDSQLGESMLLRPMVLMAAEINKTPELKAKYGGKADEYIALAENNFEKWIARGAWREVKAGARNGVLAEHAEERRERGELECGLWVIPSFGLDRATGKFTDGYERRATEAMSLPDNKENEIALEAIALYDATKKTKYRDYAEKWWRLQKARLTLRDGKFYVWNYWEAGGPWDVLPDGKLKHWVGVHPNGGYYDIDVTGIVAAYEHGLVFSKEDIDRLIATNRDFMWNQQVEQTSFKRMDGEAADKRWAKSPGVLWTALLPYDATLRKIFEANHDPSGWGGLWTTSWYLARGRGNKI